MCPRTPSLPTDPPIRTWLVGFDDADVASIRATLSDLRPAIVLDCLDRQPAEAVPAGPDGPEIWVTGPGVERRRAFELLGELFPRGLPEAHRRAVVLAGGSELEAFRPFVDRDLLFYLCAEPPPAGDTARLIASAADSLAPPPVPAPAADLELAELDEAARQRLAALDPALGPLALAAASEPLAREAVSAARASCWLYDAHTETLCRVGAPVEVDRATRSGRQESAVVGLTSFVLRTGATLRLERVGEDPRFDPEIDNDGGPDDERFLAVPLAAPRPDRSRSTADELAPTLGVMTAARTGREEPFTPRDEERLARVARAWAEALEPALADRSGAEDPHGRAGRRALLGDDGGLFRAQALDHYQSGLPDHGRVLEISPAWTGRVYHLLLLLLFASLLYGLLGRVHEYAEGLGAVRLEERIDVTAAVGGTVRELTVRPGERVRAGQVLVRLHGAQEAAELQRVRRELELGLLERLRRPADPVAARTLGALRAQLDAAESRLDERSVRSPRAGTVSDLRVRPGELISPGEVVLSLGGRRGEMALVAVLPGRYRPQLEVGMPLRLELDGFRYAYQHLEIDTLSDEVFGPSEARRALGPGLGDALAVEGPVVVIEARLPSDQFESDGKRYRFYDGSVGRVEVRVRSEPILLTLVPGLKAFFGDRHG